MGFFNDMKNRFNNNLRGGGSYGMDSFGRFMIGMGFACIIAAFIFNSMLFSLASLVILMVGFARAMSKGNYQKRQMENEMFLRRTAPIRQKWENLNNRYRDRKTMMYFKCGNCGAQLRVPRGKGKIKVTCPKCETTVIKKS